MLNQPGSTLSNADGAIMLFARIAAPTKYQPAPESV